MAALPYMQFYVADYLADTVHLTTEEHGAYLLLIFNYWQRGKPIPKSRAQRIAGIQDSARWAEIAQTLSEFFHDDGDCWMHDRIQSDLEKVTKKSGAKDEDSDGWTGYLFFIGTPSSDQIKIGFSKNPWSRLKDLRTTENTTELLLLEKIRTTNPDSELLLQKFSSDLIGSGWYTKTPAITRLLGEIGHKTITTVAAAINYLSSTVETTKDTDTDTDTDTEQKKNKNTMSDLPEPPELDLNGDPPPDDIRECFEKFWLEFPGDLGSKGSKSEALSKFLKLKPDEILLTTMRRALTTQARHKRECRSRGEFAENFPHVVRWISKRRWEDELPSLQPDESPELIY